MSNKIDHGQMALYKPSNQCIYCLTLLYKHRHIIETVNKVTSPYTISNRTAHRTLT